MSWHWHHFTLKNGGLTQDIPGSEAVCNFCSFCSALSSFSLFSIQGAGRISDILAPIFFTGTLSVLLCAILPFLVQEVGGGEAAEASGQIGWGGSSLLPDALISWMSQHWSEGIFYWVGVCLCPIHHNEQWWRKGRTSTFNDEFWEQNRSLNSNMLSNFSPLF